MVETMSSSLNKASEEETCVPVVKNTFISLQRDCPHQSRRMSIPASLRLFLESSTEGEALCQKYKLCTAFGGEDVVMKAVGPDDRAGSFVSLFDNLDDHLSYKSPAKENDSRSKPPSRSNVHARQWRKVIKRAMRILQDSGLVKYVQKSESSQACSLVLQLSAEGSSQKERVLALAQKAFLDAAVPSKSIYVVGYCSPNAFSSNESGFEATFAAMENATTACWHLFKRGTCRHGSACCNRHPIWAMPTRVLVKGETCVAPAMIGMAEMKIEF